MNEEKSVLHQIFRFSKVIAPSLPARLKFWRRSCSVFRRAASSLCPALSGRSPGILPEHQQRLTWCDWSNHLQGKGCYCRSFCLEKDFFLALSKRKADLEVLSPSSSLCCEEDAAAPAASPRSSETWWLRKCHKTSTFRCTLKQACYQAG